MKKLISLALCTFVFAFVMAARADASWNGNWQWGGNKCCGGTNVSQVNVSNISNTVVAASNTGGNESNKNWVKGSVSTTTGDATTTVSITNTTGGNVALVSGCCCDGCNGGDPWHDPWNCDVR